MKPSTFSALAYNGNDSGPNPQQNAAYGGASEENDAMPSAPREDEIKISCTEAFSRIATSIKEIWKHSITMQTYLCDWKIPGIISPSIGIKPCGSPFNHLLKVLKTMQAQGSLLSLNRFNRHQIKKILAVAGLKCALLEYKIIEMTRQVYEVMVLLEIQIRTTFALLNVVHSQSQEIADTVALNAVSDEREKMKSILTDNPSKNICQGLLSMIYCRRRGDCGEAGNDLKTYLQESKSEATYNINDYLVGESHDVAEIHGYCKYLISIMDNVQKDAVGCVRCLIGWVEQGPYPINHTPHLMNHGISADLWILTHFISKLTPEDFKSANEVANLNILKQKLNEVVRNKSECLVEIRRLYTTVREETLAFLQVWNFCKESSLF